MDSDRVPKVRGVLDGEDEFSLRWDVDVYAHHLITDDYCEAVAFTDVLAVSDL